MDDWNPVVPDHPGGTDRAVEVVVIEARPGLCESLGSHVDCGTQEREAREKSEEEKTLHRLCVCKARTSVTSLFLAVNKLFFPLQFMKRQTLKL
jgi:hypothetical protein